LPNISERIHQFNSNRDRARLPLKYKAMRENPFRFFRGTCHLIYEDLFKRIYARIVLPHGSAVTFTWKISEVLKAATG